MRRGDAARAGTYRLSGKSEALRLTAWSVVRRGMVLGMASTMVTITLANEQLAAVRKLVAEGRPRERRHARRRGLIALDRDDRG
jgi:hypothetical protein